MKELLTNESLRGIFKNNFELSHYAISLARYYIRAGHEISLAELFEQIRKNPSQDFLKELEQIEKEDAESS